MGMGIKLGLGLTAGEGVGWPSWLPLAEDGSEPLLYADYSNSRFWYNGRRYADETAHNAAWGGTKSGITRQTTTPVVVGSELVSNGDFPSATTGWTAFNSATLAVVGGQLEITGNGGNTPGASQQVATVWGKAYVFTALLNRSGPAIQAKVATNSALNSALVTVGDGGVGVPTSILGYFGGVQPAQYVGARLNAAPANGVSYADNFSVKECVPIAGWNTASGYTQVSGLITGTTPASTVSDKVLWQSDDNSERNRLRLTVKTDGHLYFISTTNNVEVASVDLGAVATSTAFSVAFSHASGSTRASLNGGAQTNVSGQAPSGCAYMRTGRSFTGETWDGTITSVAIFATSQSGAAVEQLSGNAVVAWGDSLTASTGASDAAHQYPAVAAALFTPDLAVSNKGVGGETSTQIAARQAAANRSLNARTAWIWAGRNDVGTAIDTAANIAAMVGRVIGGRYLVGSILPASTDGAGLIAGINTLNSALSATYGNRFVDVLALLKAANDGSANDLADVAAGLTPRSLRSDTVHLNDAGYAIVAHAFFDATIARGWAT